MRKREVLLRPNLAREQLEALIAPWAKQQEAEVRPMGRFVRVYVSEGESMHWHISGQERGMGTVEVTYIPSSGNLTVLVHDNRHGVWAGRVYENLAEDIKKRSKRSSSLESRPRN